MSPSAVFNAIVNDATLNSLGIYIDTVFPNWSNEERPANNIPFMILRWGEESGPIWGSEPERGPRDLTAYAHYPKELSDDFNYVNRVLNRLDVVLGDLRDIAGDDGLTLSFIVVGGRSPDEIDDGFDTIMRSANYQVYSVAN